VNARDLTGALALFDAASKDSALIAQEFATVQKLALGLFAAGRFAESLPVFAACLESRGIGTNTALHYAQACAVAGQPDRAVEIADGLLSRMPDHSDALLLKAECLATNCTADSLDAVVALFEQAQRALPESSGRVRPLLQSSRLLFNYGQFERSISTAEEALRLVPDDAEAHAEIAKCHAKLNRLPEAKRHRELSLLGQPENAEWLTHYGNLLFRLGDAVGARVVCQLADRIQPGHPRTLYELSNIAFRCERLDEAMTLMDRSIAALGTYRAKSSFARALMDLMAGRFETGWRDYEHRLGCIPLKLADPKAAQWDGGPVTGTLLIHTEQGLGDTLMLARFFPKIRAAAGLEAKIVLWAEKSLRRLLEASFEAEVIDEFTDHVVPHDAQIATGSLPWVLGVKSEADLAAPRRYLNPPKPRRIRLQKAAGRFHVGICWFGNPLHLDQVYRVIPLEQVMPVFAIEGVQFHALHIGEACEAIRRRGLPENLSLYDDQIGDLADTAGLIDQCDLVVSVDTSAIHLAGALGKESLLMLPRGSEFRWMLDRADSPWYPSVEIIRQRHFHDWAPVITEVKARIEAARDGFGQDLTGFF
jgi:tetratricopeptide (TPR) repeat protein